jgi:dipeptidyl aminopeptidase/acylaminoacyl peptidase
MLRLFLWVLSLNAVAGLAFAESLPRFVLSPEDRQRIASPIANPWRGAKAYKLQLAPNWDESGNSFWYRNSLPGGKSEYFRVDAETGEKQPISDIESLQQQQGHTGLKRRVPRRSANNGPETNVTFENKTAGEVELFWLNADGEAISYGKLGAGQIREQHTFAGHVWSVSDAAGTALGRYQAQEIGGYVEITGPADSEPRDAVPNRPRDHAQSPDGLWRAVTKDQNLWLQPREGDAIPLTTDGSPEDSYDPGSISWSPDSQRLSACRVSPGAQTQVHFVESSPHEGGPAKLHSQYYPLPGDKFPAHEVNLFEVSTRKQSKPAVERVDFGEPRFRWSADGRFFTYEKIDRGHQRFRLIQIDSHTGEARSLIDEQTDTFLWTAHTEGREMPLISWLDHSNEIVYATERSGWRHLELHDATTGELKSQITSGEYVVRGIDRIDDEQRQVWFRASGRVAGEDPYFIHHCRVNFDGTGLTQLTEGNGTHTVQYSPDRRFLIDTWSRVDSAPVHELRRTSDGQRIATLETADIHELLDAGWVPPEVFTAKGRDGQTDIWGIIFKPRQFDAGRSFPVLEDIYAGPHDSFVPKSFSPGRRNPLTDLGFWVVQIDGMGTANRSKAFHDVCWKNLKDAGLPDRILWHQAVGAKYPQYDTTRVGIYGTSAGGQESTAALLFHPEFYMAAVSSCGCHDNRMDKASWNEQWMGYPVGPHYAESSNIDQAHRLQGNLFLMVGEMDNNVPPESTLRLVDALIRHDKDFDMLVIPGLGHSNGGAYGQRRLREFFVRHLHEAGN